MRVYGNSDCGSVRSMNQDYFALRCEGTETLAVLCDGMGGAKSGNIASSLAVKTFLAAMERENQPEEVPQRLLSALNEANDAVYQRSKEDPDCDGMGTTLVAAWLDNRGNAMVLNVGDSRAYRISRNAIAQISRDHSLVAELVELGSITREDARSHPYKNYITRALGAEGTVEGDLFEIELQQQDYILLCSDGLSNLITDQELQYEVLYGGLDETCCRRLVTIALERGAPDNVTAVLICAGDEEEIS